MNRHLFAVGGLALLLSLTACAGAPMTEPSPSSSPSGSTRPPFLTTSPGPVGSPGPTTQVPSARWAAIVDDLTTRGVSGTPELVSAKSVQWQNGALGCPQPGMSYTQAIVNGMQVVVTVGDASYDYRFGTTDAPLLCAGRR